MQYRVKLRTKNPSAQGLRDNLYNQRFKKPVIVRMGSLTETAQITKGKDVVEINTVESIQNSRDKLLMKQKFNEAKVKTAKWIKATDGFNVTNRGLEFLLGQNDHEDFNGLEFPIVAKARVSQGGHGNTLINNIEEYNKWLNTYKARLQNYIFESYFNGTREYRLHVTENGCFLVWRKLRKTNAEARWYFNNDNCVWIGENNPLFDKPVNWDKIVENSVNALKAVGLSIGAMDVRVQSSKTKEGKARKTCEFIILESNSAASLGNNGIESYTNEIIKLATQKLENVTTT